jgi:hypothetical protein
MYQIFQSAVEYILLGIHMKLFNKKAQPQEFQKFISASVFILFSSSNHETIHFVIVILSHHRVG